MSKNEIHGHKVNTFNRDHIRITRARALGDPPVDATEYRVDVLRDDEHSLPVGLTFVFQGGPTKAVGPNGLTNEALIAVVIDRLECFQRGAYRCRENALAITKLEEALHWLGHRAADRERRGVAGKNES